MIEKDFAIRRRRIKNFFLGGPKTEERKESVSLSSLCIFRGIQRNIPSVMNKNSLYISYRERGGWVGGG